MATERQSIKDMLQALPLSEEDLKQYPTIAGSRDFAANKLTELSSILIRKLGEPCVDNSFCIATAGSYGRLEACQSSDIDYMVLCAKEENCPLDLISTVNMCAKELNIVPPNPEGAFAGTSSYYDLIKYAGSKDDNTNYLTRRMLLLMESRPIYNDKEYEVAISQILDKYLEYVIKDDSKEAVFLLNDAMRYFRTICVNYQFNFWNQQERWVLRNIKLRHSRIIMYAGLLLVLLNSSVKRDKVAYIKKMMLFPPLDRIISVYQETQDGTYDRILAAYERFLMRVQDDKIRKDLQHEYDDRYKSEAYREMKVTSVAISSELIRFILSQRGRWSETVFDYLIF